MEIIAFRFGWCKREVQEHFSRRERPGLRFGGVMLSLEFFVHSLDVLPALRSGPLWPKISDSLYEN